MKTAFIDFKSGESGNVKFSGSNVSAINQLVRQHPDKQPVRADVYIERNGGMCHCARYNFNGSRMIRE